LAAVVTAVCALFVVWGLAGVASVTGVAGLAGVARAASPEGLFVSAQTGGSTTNPVYTVTVEDTNPGIAGTNVVVTVRVPSTETFVAATPSEGSYDSTTGQWVVGTVTAGTLETLMILTTNNGSAPASLSPTVTAGNAVSIGITNTVSDPTPTVGEDVTYAVVVTNAGAAGSHDLTVLDLLQTGLTFVSAASPGESCTASGQIVDCDIGSLASGSSHVILIVVRVGAAGARTANATVALPSADLLENPGDMTAAATLNASAPPAPTVPPPAGPGTTRAPAPAVSPRATLTIKVTGATAKVASGGTATYRIRLTNAGPAVVASPLVTTSLSAAVRSASGRYPGGVCRGGRRLACRLRSIPAHRSVTLTIRARPARTGTLRARVSVTTRTVLAAVSVSSGSGSVRVVTA